MQHKFLNTLLKENVPVNLIHGNGIRIIIQNDDLQNESWESDVKAIKALIDNIPIGSIEKDTEDPLICEKIFYLLLDSLGQLMRDSDHTSFSPNKNNIDIALYFLKLRMNKL